MSTYTSAKTAMASATTRGLRTYRGKFEGDPQDNNAYPAFEAESLEQAVDIANARWPAVEDEKPFTAEVMQVLTQNGWAPAGKWVFVEA